MQLRFTIYNCGTGSNRNSGDVIGQLNNETVSLHMINDGPGGGGPSGNPGGAFTITGLIGGVGVDANVAHAVAEVKRRKTVGSMVLNMCGWSRGGVTCFKIAQALYAEADTRDVAVNIFAIDPVPGGSGFNNHMWRSIDLKPNVRTCQVILSQHDRRSLFAPYIPPLHSQFTDIDIMPGDHSTLVEPKGSRRAAYEIVKDRARKFLGSHGTVFGGAPLLSSMQVLEKYAEIAEQFDDYARFASGASSKSAKRFEGTRPLRDVNRKVMGQMLPVKPAFFLSEHHRETCRSLYPQITNEIERDPKEAFQDATRPRWMPEFDQMVEAAPRHSHMTLFYIIGCEAKRR